MFGHVKRMNEAKFVKGVYGSETEEQNRSERDDRRDLEHAVIECQNWEKWKLFCHSHPVEGVPRSGSRHRR